MAEKPALECCFCKVLQGLATSPTGLLTSRFQIRVLGGSLLQACNSRMLVDKRASICGA
jgi:hypothetical protein